ncbi:bifunctional oligoribonuclease/PAP phosphatase NrnA, partial [Enterococcus faecalis]|nr:bifunctional oligoribonuclease/PAP phosphatase NrnA [Enterococcus faecalis]
HHGGGHPLASGANAKDLEEVAVIYQEIQAAIKEFQAE